MPLEAVDYDPFSGAGRTLTVPGQNGAPTRVIMDMRQAPQLEPVDHDPFARSPMDTAKGLYNAFESGVEKAGAGLTGALGDLTDYGARGIGAASDRINNFLGLEPYRPQSTGPIASVLNNIPRSADMQKAFNERYRGNPNADPYEPQNTGERYAHAAGEFLLGGAGKAKTILQRGAQIAFPSTLSETAGHAFEGSKYEPFARLGGAVLGGGAATLTSRPGNAANSIRQQLPAGVTPQMVDQAGALISAAKARGIDLAWPEALSQVAGRPILTNTMRHLEASPQTEARMGEFFGARPQQIESAARSEFNAISPLSRQPGGENPSGIGPAAGRAAQSTIADVRAIINKASEPYYLAAEGQLYSPAEFRAIKQIPGFNNALKAVRSNDQINWRIKHLPDNSVGVLNAVKKHFDQAAENAASKFNPAANQEVRTSNEMAASAVKQINIAKSQDYEIAVGLQHQTRQQYLQPLLDGPLGKLAKKDVTTQKAIKALFPENPLANSEHEISTTVSALAKRNPKAAADLVRAHMEAVFNEAARDLQTGANQAGGAKFRTQLIGNAQQHANLQAAIEALPGGAQRWDGFKNFLDVLEATGTRQNVGSRTAYNAEFNKMQGAGGLVRDATKIATNPVRALKPLIDKYEQYKLGKNLSGLANILTDPSSGALLKSIAKMPKGGFNAQMVALKLLTYANASSIKKPNQ